VKLQEHSWSLFLWHKKGEKLAQALTREDEIERTSIYEFNRRGSFTARENTSLVTVME
jgi:hypothetical protein